MELTEAQRVELVRLLERGQVSATQVARLAGITRQAVHKWFDASQAQRSRAAYETALILAVLHPLEPGKAPRLPKQEKQMRVVSQENEHKREVLRALRRGKMNVKQAAKKAGVSERAIRQWCALNHIRLKPAQEQAPTVKKPLSAAAIKNSYG